MLAVIQGVVAIATVVSVVACTRDQGVVARFSQQAVVTQAAFNQVIASTRPDRVVANTSVNRIVARSRGDRIGPRMGRHEPGLIAVEHHVIARARLNALDTLQRSLTQKTIDDFATGHRHLTHGHAAGA